MHVLDSVLVASVPQEWASANNINLPHRENKANSALLYKWEDEAPPVDNILQARAWSETVHVHCHWPLACMCLPHSSEPHLSPCSSRTAF